MSVQTLTRYIATCDDCGTTREIVGGTPADASATLNATGWSAPADGPVRCPSCAALALCALVGHDWTPWGAVAMIHGHGTCREHRTCGRCPAREHRDPARL